MYDFTTPLAEVILRARKKAKLTQAQLAELAGVEQSSIVKMENPVRNANPELATLWPVIRVLDIDPFEFFYPGIFREDARIRLLRQMVGECTEQEADALIPVIKEMIVFMRRCKTMYVSQQKRACFFFKKAGSPHLVLCVWLGAYCHMKF